jgi:predicted DNA-binding WGR domain protein
MTFLTRTDPTRNVNRFYIVDVTPTLFVEWTILREWGRRDSPRTMRLDHFEHRADPDAAHCTRHQCFTEALKLEENQSMLPDRTIDPASAWTA